MAGSFPASAAWPAGCYVTAAGDYICNNYTPPAPPPAAPPPAAACNTPDPLNINPSAGGGYWVGNHQYGHAQDNSYTHGYHVISSTSCLGYPAKIVDKVSRPDYTGNWIHQTLDPLAANLIDLRYVRASGSALIFRFRTPAAGNYVQLSYLLMNIGQVPWAAAGLSKQPCDTTTNLIGPPLTVPTATDYVDIATTLLVKGGQCPSCNMAGYGPTLEPNQIYYFTVLDTNPVGPTDDGFIDAMDRAEFAIRHGPHAGQMVCTPGP